MPRDRARRLSPRNRDRCFGACPGRCAARRLCRFVYRAGQGNLARSAERVAANMSILAMPLEFFFGQETYVCSRVSTLHHDAESLDLLTTAHAGRLLRDLSFLGEHQIIARICHFADLHVASDML